MVACPSAERFAKAGTDLALNYRASKDPCERLAARVQEAGRLGSPRDVAECALFLATDASGFLTGQMLGPNGGNVM